MAALAQKQDSTSQLGTDSIWKLLIRFSLPSIIAMTVSALYNLADRVFIGIFVGELALGGLTASFPLMLVIISFASLFSSGGAALISIEFGRKNKEKANQIYGNTMLMLVLFSAVVIILAFIFLTPLLRLIGATESNLPYAVDYTRVCLVGMFFQLPSMVMSGLIRIEGKPRLSMTSQLIAGTTNVILNYLFIGVFDWGVLGAAYATVIGQAVGFAIMVWYFFFSGQSQLKLSRANLRPQLVLTKSICALGISGFMGQMSNSISSALLNISLSTYGGDAALTAAGAMGSMATLAIMPIFGLQQGLSPIVGYNHGMGSTERVKSALLRGIFFGTIAATSIFAILQLFPTVFASFFINPTSPTMQVCVRAMRLNMLMMPLVPLGLVGSAYFHSTAQPAKALFLSLSRAFVFLIPFVLLLPRFLDLDGVWLAQPAADLCSTVVTVVFLVNALKSKKLTLSEK